MESIEIPFGYLLFNILLTKELRLLTTRSIIWENNRRGENPRSIDPKSIF